jgi:CheY-like chemotaxis protein
MVRTNRLLLVIEEDPTRIESMAVALRGAGDLVVTVVDAQDGRTVLSLLQKLFDDGRVPDVAMVRSSPVGWTTAALLALLRSTRYLARVDVVLVVEGKREMLPVIISDFPGVRLVPPDGDISALLAELSPT